MSAMPKRIPAPLDRTPGVVVLTGGELRERLAALARLESATPPIVSVYPDTDWSDEHVKGSIRAALWDPASVLVERAVERLALGETRELAAEVDAVLVEAAESGRAAAGPAATLEAVWRRAVHRLFLLATRCDGGNHGRRPVAEARAFRGSSPARRWRRSGSPASPGAPGGHAVAVAGICGQPGSTPSRASVATPGSIQPYSGSGASGATPRSTMRSERLSTAS